ncbi:hypothetical protein GMOD_00007516 [Pyrenophora seminiperda CCB06]|uniref:Uncharacterized protein n=1 Tax=Pyrenophora seminiperda CCB06 TaxID=1302712 RepID=A0A3M7MDR3_9PLEO|nr:hypothetical protein GMOD_00007516 [Pyrenophora seminiperda CCB06]
MSDIEKSFTFLQDNIPQWLQDIARVEERVTAMQAENEKVAISLSPFANQTASNASIRPGKLDVIDETAAPDSRGPGSRKRSLSVSSGHVSGSSRHRARTMVVVNYDGDMQKSFELLVRAIGTGRHMLRKAKMEARMNEMAASAKSSEDEDDADDDEEEDVSLSRVNYRARMSSLRARSAARRSGRLGVSSGVATPAELFDNTDKTLEQAQELSEKAAHLVLREGDCRKELEGVQKHLVSLLETAKAQVAICNERKSSQDPPELQAHETSDTSLSSVETEMPSYKKTTPQQTSLPITESDIQSKSEASAATAPIPPKIIDIEVDDDDDDDDEDFVLPPVRLTSRLNRRG